MDKLHTICSSTRHALGRLYADESGATAIEYAMIAAGVGAALAATITSLGSSVKSSLYDKIATIFQ